MVVRCRVRWAFAIPMPLSIWTPSCVWTTPHFWGSTSLRAGKLKVSDGPLSHPRSWIRGRPEVLPIRCVLQVKLGMWRFGAARESAQGRSQLRPGSSSPEGSSKDNTQGHQRVKAGQAWCPCLAALLSLWDQLYNVTLELILGHGASTPTVWWPRIL